jgi:hypothetical protein
MSPALIPFTVSWAHLFGCCNKRRGQPMVPETPAQLTPRHAGMRCGLVDRNLSLATIFFVVGLPWHK